MATAIIKTEEEPTCPICLGLFNVPRQLPCAHTFCQSCLQSFITSKVTEHEKRGYIECPVCRKTAGHFKQNQPTSEWASDFPADRVKQSMLATKSKVDRICNACNSDGVSITATGFCIVCEEALCSDCLKVHRKLKISKPHTILTIGELLNNPQNAIKFAEGFTCFQHNSENLKFYCNNHKVACCGICFFESHKTCPDVRKLKEELPALLHETKPNEIIEELKKLETHLKKFIDVNESNVSDFESQVNGLIDQIREMRNKINAAFDELEIKVSAEGRRIHKELAFRTQEENNQCLSMLHAVRNSHLLCQAGHKYGTDVQQFLIADKIKLQLPSYYTQIKEKFEKNYTVTVQVEFSPLVESIASLSSSAIGDIVTKTGLTQSIPGLQKPTKECKVEIVETVHVNISRGTLGYTGVAILPRERVIVVLENTKQCILLNNFHEVVTNYTLTENVSDICVVDDNEVAVSAYHQNKIQILSVRDDVITPVRTIATKHKCCGITAALQGEMVVIEDCGYNKYCWSLMRDGREVYFSDQYDSTSGCYNYIALNNSKTRVYITDWVTDSIHCFNIEGKKLYKSSPKNLIKPLGVAVDRDDNIYIIGGDSHSIHQLSPDGSILKVITAGIPQNPFAISFDNIRDIFIITNSSESEKLYIYQLK